MKKIFKLFVAVVATASFASCELDYYPTNAIPYTEGVCLFQLPEDIVSYENGIYANARALFAGTYDVSDDLMFDGFNATRNYGNRYGAIHTTNSGFTPSDEYVEAFWANNYTAIKNFNIIIENAEIAPANLKEDADFIAGEARLARAISYLRLARRYGKAYDASTAASELCVPLVLKYDQNERPARATVKAVYDAIKADLDVAAEQLADEAGEPAAQYFTVDVVNAMYANYYLDVKDYANAYKYASELIASGTYSLCTTKAALDKQFNEDSGNEAIFQPFVSLQELAGNYPEYVNYGKESNSPTGDAFSSGYIPSQVLISAYEVTDYRFQVWFDRCSTVPFSCDGSYTKDKFYIFTKYKGNTALNASGVWDSHVAPKPFTIAEMHLIAAEAALNGGSSKLNGLAALTALQSARNATPATALTAEAVQMEWFKETVGEGRRMECLKRWNKGFSGRAAQAGAIAENVIQTIAGSKDYEEKALPAGDYHYCWPIPSYEIKVNPNLVQNEGYSAIK